MKLSTSLVPVKKITSKIDRSQFSNDTLNQAAKLILEAKGVINPIILHRTSLESYEVVDGDFEYYAAARAREIDPRKGEMIGAFIIEPDNEEVIKEQIKVIRKQGSDDNHKPKGENLSQENVESHAAKVEQTAETVTLLNKLDSKQINTQNKLEIITDKVEQIAEAIKKVEIILSKQQEPKPRKSKNNKIELTGYHSMAKEQIENLNSMTKDQLKNLAKQRKIKVTTRMTKPELINALAKADVSEY